MRIGYGYGYCFIDLDFKGEKTKTDPLVQLSLTLKQAILFGNSKLQKMTNIWRSFKDTTLQPSPAK